ncbi:MAG TPA: hypothetical protein VF002_10385, partial [Gaiellaceae bacterium]
GAGRRAKDDPIDHAVGVVCLKKVGDRVSAEEPIAEIHARDNESAEGAAVEVQAAYELAAEPPAKRAVILGLLAS